ncbi:MAG: alpha/beta hydrolase [Candidatus Hydrogenedentes bacterium]|nr:alpha/beta hydrolase [Candidatus Hydrogenedentota bacterium]
MKRKLLLVLIALLVLALAGAGWTYHNITKRVVGEYFDADGVRIHYTVEGQGEPVVLVHGFAANADANWRAPGITEALAKDYKVICLDNRGHGLSGKPHDPAKYGTEFCKDIVRLLDHLKIEKAHVVGYSMGSFITLKFVTMYPERLLSAAPCGAGWERENDPDNHTLEIAESLEERQDFTPLFQAISPPGKLPGRRGLLSINYVLNLTNDAKALACVMRSLNNLIVTEAELKACTVPTISIVGTNDPLRDGVDRMKDVMGNHETVYIEGTDHISTIRDPKFLDTLRAFLKKHGAGAKPEEHESRQAA